MVSSGLSGPGPTSSVRGSGGLGRGGRGRPPQAEANAKPITEGYLIAVLDKAGSGATVDCQPATEIGGVVAVDAQVDSAFLREQRIDPQVTALTATDHNLGSRRLMGTNDIVPVVVRELNSGHECPRQPHRRLVFLL